MIAVDERNDDGGILGREVELVVGDSNARASKPSSAPTSRRQATTSSRTGSARLLQTVFSAIGVRRR